MDDRLGDLLEVTPTEIRYADSPTAECRSSEMPRHVIVRNRTQQDRIDVLMAIQEPFGELISVVYPSSVIASEDLPPPFTRALLGLDPGERILLKNYPRESPTARILGYGGVGALLALGGGYCTESSDIYGSRYVVGGGGCLVFGARLAEAESIRQYLRLPIVISSSPKAMVTEKSEDTLPTRPVSTTTQESGCRAVGDCSDATVLAADGSSCLDHSLVDSGDSESGKRRWLEPPCCHHGVAWKLQVPRRTTKARSQSPILKTGRTLYLVEGVGYCTSSGTMVIPLDRPPTRSSGISGWSGMSRPCTRAQEEARIRRAWDAFGGI
ncbi:Signal peptidase complex subunit 3 [Perkinsus olseni]|uniref:Signal peptidase complex subunit 3 n=1 Tax=Perkinsus olseni TaxID=32597 RepID=A0A7J6NN59_PEROL|nr:Signal peptidase complex subunit 3 [Perkinsus olseni]